MDPVVHFEMPYENKERVAKEKYPIGFESMTGEAQLRRLIFRIGTQQRGQTS